MIRERGGPPLIWPCVDLACNEILGHIANGELAVDTSKAMVNSDGVNMVLTCLKCGKPKTWFAKAPAVQNAFVDTLIQKLSKEIRGRM